MPEKYGGPGGRERTVPTTSCVFCAFHLCGFVVITESTSTVSGKNVTMQYRTVSLLCRRLLLEVCGLHGEQGSVSDGIGVCRTCNEREPW